MKKLTQEDSKSQPPWVKSMAIDSSGSLMGYDCDLTRLYAESGYWASYGKGIIFCELDSGYDTTDWQNSAIERV